MAEFDAYKHNALPLTGDARATLEELPSVSEGYAVAADYRAAGRATCTPSGKPRSSESTPFATNRCVSQGELIGAVNELGDPDGVMICAAGSLPGDLHKLWRSRHPKNYHLEYGYSCMGYEIAGGLGIKMAAPDREVYVMVGDGSYLMLCNEIITSIQEGYKLTIVLMDNSGYNSIGGSEPIARPAGIRNSIRLSRRTADYPVTTPATRCAPAGRSGDERPRPGRACHRVRNLRRFHAALGDAQNDRSHDGHLHSQRSLRRACPATKAGGTCPSRKSARWRRCARLGRNGKPSEQKNGIIFEVRMTNIRIANAPCSWGSWSSRDSKGTAIGYEQMLDELVDTGYHGTELGDWGYMPTDAAAAACRTLGPAVETARRLRAGRAERRHVPRSGAAGIAQDRATAGGGRRASIAGTPAVARAGG